MAAQVDNPLESGPSQRGGGDPRTRTMPAVDDDFVGPGHAHLGRTRRQLVKRNVHRTRDVAGRKLRGGANIEDRRTLLPIDPCQKICRRDGGHGSL